MIGSVRARLTAAVALVVGGLAVGAALAAPHVVREALVDDRLDAEVVREADSLDAAAMSPRDERRLGPPELTALFGPQIAALTSSLDESGALARLRSFDRGGRVHVTPMPGVVGTVDPDGTVRVDVTDAADIDGPIVTVGRLEELSAIFDPAGPDFMFDLFADDDLTFEDFVTDLDRRFGTDIGERLDVTVFEGFPPFELGDGEIPRGVFDMLQDELIPALEGPAAVAPTPATVDDYIFGTRRVDQLDVVVTASADGIDRSVDRVEEALWLTVPIAMLLAGGVTWLLAGRALRPVRAITEQTRRIRSSTLHERVPVPGADDEVRALATEMNTMLARVQREDERRRQFVADASHELRSPIAAIRTQAEAALATAHADHSADHSDDHSDDHSHDHSDDLTVDLAAGVLAEAERMSVLVDDLLSLARHDEELAAPGTVLDLDDVVLAEAQRLRRVPVDVSGVSAGQVRGRADEMARVVTHLLDNAARHATERVAVRLETDERQVVLLVDDDGPGVPVDERERVFERFVRLDEARHRDGGGAGLGLAVVASVVRAGGGSVAVSDGPMGGARFEVVLPSAS